MKKTAEQLQEEKEGRRAAYFSDFAENKRTAAEEFPFCQESSVDQWVKLVWYSDECGGKLITFKAGNPYLPKTGKRKEGENISEQQREVQRVAASLSRTRKRVFEIAACNTWEWFFTGTLDASLCDRDDLNGTFKKIAQFVRDYRKATGYDVKYMLVPELHKKGGWHFHGLLNGIPESELHKFTTVEKIPARIKRTIESGTDIFTWSAYADKFGYSTMTRVRDANAVACYVTKYITKDMIKDNASLGTRRHLFYASQGLEKPETLAESYPCTSWLPTFDFENEWIQIRKIESRDEAEAIIKNYGLTRGKMK